MVHYSFVLFDGQAIACSYTTYLFASFPLPGIDISRRGAKKERRKRRIVFIDFPLPGPRESWLGILIPTIRQPANERRMDGRRMEEDWKKSVPMTVGKSRIHL